MDPAFREEIKMALGAAAAGSGDEVSKQSPPSHTHSHTHNAPPSQSESSLDDEAMEMVDEALAAVFRSRFAHKHQNKQKKGKTTRRVYFSMTCFLISYHVYSKL